MDQLDPPKCLSLDGNLAENWKRFKQRFELYLEASGATEKEEKTQACLFLHVIGEDALEIYNNFQFAEVGDKLRLDKIMEKFDTYCNPKKNQTFERHKFFTCVQKQDEKIDAYVNKLRTKAKTCEFNDLTESLIRDRIVCGIRDSAVRARLLCEQDLDLHKAITICRAAESTMETLKELNPENGILGEQSGDLEPGTCLQKCDFDYGIIRKIVDLETRLKQMEEKKPISFSAQLSHQLENPPDEKTVVFDSVQTSLGQGYNPSTGIFGAPYSGVYSFSLTASSPPKDSGNLLQLYIMKNAEQVGYVFLDDNTDRWVQRSTSTVVALEAGDHVFVKIGSSKGTVTLAGCCFHTMFSGFLIN